MVLFWGRRAAARCAELVLALSLWSAGAHGAAAAEYFVAPGGNNSWPGTADQPWASLQTAANRVTAGDRVVVRPGDYAGFYLSTDGTAAAPIVFFAEPGARITTRNATTPDGINLEGASHVVIDGFTVNGMPRAGVRSVLGDFVTIRNVTAADNQRWGIFTGFVDDLVIENNRTSGSILEHGIYVSNSGDRPTIRNNVTFGNHGSGIHMNGDLSQGGDGIISGALVSGNIVFDNAKPVNGGPAGGGSGINMDGVQSSRIENNLVYGNRASGISLYRIDGAQGSKNNIVVNNTVHQPANGRWALNISDASTGNTVLNNILVSDHSFRGSIAATADSLAGMTSNYNALAPRFSTDTGDTTFGLAQWRSTLNGDAQSFAATAAALFVDATNADLTKRDYHLKPGVAALDAGTAMLAPAVDAYGTARPQGLGVDMGAIETRAALAADFNNNGVVDSGDLAAWASGAGIAAGATKMQGDADGDHDVDGADFLIWQRQVTPPGATAAPEPAAAVLGAIAMGVSMGRSGAKRRLSEKHAQPRRL
jgi:parallel beta-helix repeat protein